MADPDPQDQTTAGTPSAEPNELSATEQAALAEIRRMADQLTELLNRTLQEQKQLREEEQAFSTETTADLLVLLTALGPLRSRGAAAALEPSPIDEYVEDMIDPEFGLRPARRGIVAAAQHILRGYDALRFPATPPAGTDD